MLRDSFEHVSQLDHRAPSQPAQGTGVSRPSDDPGASSPERALGSTYAQLLHKAAKRPEALTADDRARLLPEDVRLIAGAYDREIARAGAQAAGLRVADNRIGDKRRRELLAMARKGDLHFSQIPVEDLRAIDNTPGLWDEILEVEL